MVKLSSDGEPPEVGPKGQEEGRGYLTQKNEREKAGIKEGDEVIAEASEGMIVLKRLRPKVVDIDPELIEEFLREEYGLEGRKCGNILEA